MSKSYKELFELYENVFKPAYADLVSYIGRKPINILVEMENALAHIFVSFDDSQPSDIRSDNVKKAYNHIVRATLDCYKLLWVQLNEDIDEIFKSNTKRLALTMPESEFLKLRSLFKEKAREARKKELNNVGKNPLAPVKEYMEAIEIGKQIINSLDNEKEGRARRFLLRSKWWELITAFVLGLLVNKVYDLFFK